ncbi:MAG TPA: SMP-30/gluconolactonase/LRE family protein [Alphaproteobacteria bacterium]|nr:SMP-30/gluconolactonase/LRE family protein [Alphaproteobacteria bacterium]
MSTFAHIAAGLAFACLALPAMAGGVETINAKSLYPEGPLWLDGKALYVEYSGHTVMAWDGKANTQIWKQDGCGPAALAKVPEGLLVTCYDTSTLVTISLDGKTLDTTDSAKAGVSLKGVNDLAEDGKGGIYMSASGVFDTAAPIEGTVVYRAPDGGFHEVANDIHYSNGMAVTDGGKSLLVSEMLAARVLKFDVAADGSLSNRRVFVRLKDVVADPEGADAYYGPDGLKVGASGNVYIAQNGGGSILVVSPEGKLVRQLPVPGKYVTNVGFGADEGTLIVTAATDPWNAPYPGEVYLVENK